MTTKKPTIALCMIVKNEEKVIERCLKAAKKHFDTCCIYDTGSTDKTKEIIKAEMKRQRKKGVLLDSIWKDYGTNRTEVFDYVYKHKLADYALVLDADDIISGPRPEMIANVGEITIVSEGITYRQRRLFDMRMEWEYRGKLHEAPYAKHDTLVLSEVIQGTVINHMHDGGSWTDEKAKYEEHVKVALSQDLNDPRNQFYLAQSLRAAGRFREAMAEYKKRAEMPGGWYQEAVYSQLQIARLEHIMGETDRATLDYMKCFEMDPERGEALVELTLMARRSDKFNIGALFGEKLLETGQKTEGKIFVEKVITPMVLLEIGLCRYYTENKVGAKSIWNKALRMENIDESVKTALKENLKWVK